MSILVTFYVEQLLRLELVMFKKMSSWLWKFDTFLRSFKKPPVEIKEGEKLPTGFNLPNGNDVILVDTLKAFKMIEVLRENGYPAYGPIYQSLMNDWYIVRLQDEFEPIKVSGQAYEMMEEFYRVKL